MINKLPAAVHLDARWDECFSPQPDYTAWPDRGLIDSLVHRRDCRISMVAVGVALKIATYAAEGLRTIPIATLAEPAEDLDQMHTGLRELADHGYLSLSDGVA